MNAPPHIHHPTTSVDLYAVRRCAHGFIIATTDVDIGMEKRIELEKRGRNAEEVKMIDEKFGSSMHGVFQIRTTRAISCRRPACVCVCAGGVLNLNRAQID